MRKERESDTYENGFFCVIKGALAAFVFAFAAMIIFANILSAAALPDSVIYPINQAIKGIAVAVGAILFVKGEKGWLKGGAIALVFTALAYPVFSAICGSFAISWWILVELVTAFFIGALGGILAVNFRKS